MSVEVSYYSLVAIYYFETVLKNFGKCRHTGVSVLHVLPRILQKLCNFSVLRRVLSICTNFQNHWLKTWLDIRNLVLNGELCRKFAGVLKVCQRWRHKQNTRSGIILYLDLSLTCVFFFKDIFLEGVSLNKIKFHKIR